MPLYLLSAAQIDFQSLATGDFHLAMVEAEQIEDRRVDIGDIMAIFGGVEAQFVSGAVDDASFDAAAGQRDREAVGMMVAALIVVPGVRPNSVAITTIVSSNSPRCLRSPSSANRLIDLFTQLAMAGLQVGV